MKIKSKDKVKVIAGKFKSKESTVEKVIGNKIIVAGVNEVKRHVKGNAKQKPEIAILTKPIDISNVMLVCPKCSKPTRVGYKLVDNKKYRMCKKCKEII